MYSYFPSLFVSVPVSDAYVNVLCIVMFFSLNFSFFDVLLFLKTIFVAILYKTNSDVYRSFHIRSLLWGSFIWKWIAF